jgi:exopolyphosphatase/guanosine-5'-triphosphate,3'-diphosphate pyrophosphatase
MMLAAIDAGSNTLRLLIGKVQNGKVAPLLYERRICRLAGGFKDEEGLSPEAKERTLFAFQRFAEICEKNNVSKVRVVGTAAFRQAINGESFADKVRSTTQLPLTIISGEEEAETMTAGVLSALNPVPDNALIVDIGGGSTEFVLCSKGKVLWARSLPLGVVRLAEGYENPEARQCSIAQTLTLFKAELARACVFNDVKIASLALVGTAGTVTTLAALDQQMIEYDWRQINNYLMPLSRILYWREQLAPLTPAERESLPGMEAGRGDLIPAGIEIILGLMQQLNNPSLTVSDFGILEGLLLSLESSE